MVVEISKTDQRLLITHGTPASIKPAGNPTNSSALPIITSVIPASQAERVTNLAKDISTTSFWRSARLRSRPPNKYNPECGGSIQL